MRRRLPFDAMLVLLAVVLCLGFWWRTYTMRYTWEGLPPAPNAAESLAYGFGDTQFSYRSIGMMLQNAGDIGGLTTNLKNYNFQHLRDWFELTYALDKKADYAPSLAAFYFGGTPKAEDVRYLVDYLALVGSDKVEGQERWRWLAHAVYLARFRLKDQGKALELADMLANSYTPDMPIWTKQMPAFVLSNVGQKKAARDLMLTIAATDKSMQQADINQTCWYVDHNLREPQDGLESDPVYSILCNKNKR